MNEFAFWNLFRPFAIYEMFIHSIHKFRSFISRYIYDVYLMKQIYSQNNMQFEYLPKSNEKFSFTVCNVPRSHSIEN